MYVGMPMWIIRPLGMPSSARLLESYGYNVGIIAQPDWKDDAIYFSSGRTASWLFGFRRKYGLYGQPLFGIQKETHRRMPIHRAVSWENVRIMHPSYIAT